MNTVKNIFNFNNTPIWFMRQAGRYMYEYNNIKKKFNNFFSMCKNINAVTDITLLPVRKFNFDAAIIFSDILIVLECLNIKVNFIKGKGPVVSNTNVFNIFKDRTNNIDLEKLYPVYESIKSVKKELHSLNKPLIGFSGAPWTIAAYMLEGSLTKDLSVAKTIAYKDPEFMRNVTNVLSDIIIEHIIQQIDSGVDMIQIFDTHANTLDYYSKEKYSIEPVKNICRKVKELYPAIPISYFSKDTNYNLGELYKYIDVVSFSSSVRMKDYTELIPKNIIFQGNLDPIKLIAGGTEMKNGVLSILQEMHDKEFIFNLGHGILPQTPRKNVEECIDLVKSFRNQA